MFFLLAQPKIDRLKNILRRLRKKTFKKRH